MKNIKEAIKNIVKEESEYKQFFKKALEKSGKSITDMSDEEKKAFFNKIDAAWDGKGEKNEGNAFGAAVVKAKKEGDTEFEVGGKTYKVESVNEESDTDKVWVVTKNKGQAYQISKKAYDANKDRYILAGNRIQAGVYAKQIRDKKKVESVNEAKVDWKEFYTMAKDTSGYNPEFEKKYGKILDRPHVADALKKSKDFNSFVKFVNKFESVNEGKFDAQLDKIEAAVKNASSFMGVGAELKKAGIKYDFTTSMIPMYMIKVPGNTIAIVNKKYAAGAEREVGDTAIGLLEGYISEGNDVKASTVKIGNKIGLSSKYNPSGLNTPFVVKSIDKKDGYLIFKGNTPKEILKIKETSPVELHETINEGNAFGAAVTAAKKEGKKEFEFNGKTYKIKKGSYEKNEAAKKLTEKNQSVTKK
jgi:hypothetical protein